MQLLFQETFDRPSGGSHLSDATVLHASTLHRQCLVHDGTSSSNELEVGDGPATWGLVGGGGQGAQSAWRRFLHEGAHALGLTEERFHGVAVSLRRVARSSEREGQSGMSREVRTTAMKIMEGDGRPSSARTPRL